MAVATAVRLPGCHRALGERLVFPALESLMPLPELGNSLLPRINGVFHCFDIVVAADSTDKRAAVYQRNAMLVAELHVVLGPKNGLLVRRSRLRHSEHLTVCDQSREELGRRLRLRVCCGQDPVPMLVAQRLLSKAAMCSIALRILADGCRQNAVTIVD